MMQTTVTAPGKVAVLGWQALTAPGMLGVAEWFDVDTLLGKRGHKYLSEGTKYWLAASGALGTAVGHDPDRQGIVVGTNFGAHRTLTDLFQVAKSSGSSTLSPLSSPNFSINLIASHGAIKSGARRFNLTLTTPQVAGLDALVEAGRRLLRGHCDGALAGAAEEGLRNDLARPARLQGAVAASLARADAAPASGLARLSGFAEAHNPGGADWIARLAQREMAPGADPAWRASARLRLVSDDAALEASLAHIAAAAGVTAAPPHWQRLRPNHGCLEPLQALHDAMVDDTPSLFLYVSKRGAFRSIVVEPVSPFSQTEALQA